ncbi:MAG: hypothetical protein J5783_03490 [Lachnospiraceae bacterium]|nr:hypothetical protein [Lachnospiraceae bacterium]
MKKFLKLFCCMMVVTLLISGCSKDEKNDNNPSNWNEVTDAPTVTDEPKVTDEPDITDEPNVTDAPAVTDEPVVTDVPQVTDEPKVTDEPQVTDTPVITDTPGITDAPVVTLTPEEVKAAYDEFIEGKRKAVATTDAGMLEEGRSYHFDELVEDFGTKLEKESLPNIITGKEKAYIDCGMDGYPELVLKLSYEREEYEDSPDDEFIVLRLNGDELNIVTNFAQYYRSFADINEYGYITIGGSGGATTYTNTNSFVTAEGKEVFLWTETGRYGFDKPYFPMDAYEIPDDVKAVVAREVGYAEGGNAYEMDRVSFSEYDCDSTDPDEQQRYNDEYLLNCYYTFVNDDGENAVTDEEYVKLCNDNIVKLVTKEELDQMRADKAMEYGCTSEIVSGGLPEWVNLDGTSEE